MRHLIRFAVLLVCCPLLFACSVTSIPDSHEGLGLGEISFDIPKPITWKLENGLQVYYYHNDELPEVRGKMYLPGGQLYERSLPVGISDVTGDQMREGSIRGFTPDAFDKHLDDLAASIESGYGEEFGSVGFYCLEEDFDEVFRLYTEVIRRPSFNSKRLALWKKLAAEGIRRRRDNPDTMASMAFGALLYGKDSLFARSLGQKDLAKLTRANMRAYHQKFVRPDGAKLAVTGSLPKDKMKAAIEKYFGDWKPGTAELPSLPLIGHVAEPGIYVLEREFEQASILIGHRGPPRRTPDIYEMKIYNRVFGHGGFGSTLFKEIRTNRGLAYSVYGGLWPGTVEGLFQVSMGTRVEKAIEAIEESVRLSAESTTALPDGDDFAAAKSAVERSFVFKFANANFVAQRAVLLDLWGFPQDFDATYLERIASVGPEQVKGVGERWVKPEEFVVVVVGNVSAEKIAEAFKGKKKVFRLGFDTEPRVLGEVS